MKESIPNRDFWLFETEDGWEPKGRWWQDTPDRPGDPRWHVPAKEPVHVREVIPSREWVVALHKDGTIWSPHSGTTGPDYQLIRVSRVVED